MRNDETKLQRVSVPALDAILGEMMPVLDHGFIRVVDYLGDDSSIVQAARVSYGKGTQSLREDRGLIRYLMRHRHTTPMEMCEIKLHVKLPIFVARQWIRHRCANVNEYSARYSVLDREFYVPEAEHIGVQDPTNRQGRDQAMSDDEAGVVQRRIVDASMASYEAYGSLLKGKLGIFPGVARELSRAVLPVNFYTQWYWKIDLHNLLHFLWLRMDGHAQYEIRAYANVIADIVSNWVPLTWEAWNDYEFQGVKLSRMEVEALKIMLSGSGPAADLEALGMTKREQGEFKTKWMTRS